MSELDLHLVKNWKLYLQRKKKLKVLQFFCFSAIKILYLPVLFLPQGFFFLFLSKPLFKQKFLMFKVFKKKTWNVIQKLH